MGPLTVLFIQPAFSYFPCFFQCSEQIKIQYSVRNVRLNRSINAFCVGLPGLINSSITSWASALCARASDISFGPLSIRLFSGNPRFATILFNTHSSCCAGIFRSISIARASRLKSPTTLKGRTRRPHVRAACIKSIDQFCYQSGAYRLHCLCRRRTLSLSEVFCFSLR